jgi:hypothetical protein
VSNGVQELARDQSRVTLTIKSVKPQYFKSYALTATNAIGHLKTTVAVVKDTGPSNEQRSQNPPKSSSSNAQTVNANPSRQNPGKLKPTVARKTFLSGSVFD